MGTTTTTVGACGCCSSCNRLCKVKIIGDIDPEGSPLDGLGVFSIITYCDTFRAVAYFARSDGTDCSNGCEGALEESAVAKINEFTAAHGGTVTYQCQRCCANNSLPNGHQCTCGCRVSGSYSCWDGPTTVAVDIPYCDKDYGEPDEECGIASGWVKVEYHVLENTNSFGELQWWSASVFAPGNSPHFLPGFVNTPGVCDDVYVYRQLCSDGWSDSNWADYDKVLDYYEDGRPVYLYKRFCEKRTTQSSRLGGLCCVSSGYASTSEYSAWVRNCETGKFDDITHEIIYTPVLQWCSVSNPECAPQASVEFCNSNAALSSISCVQNPLP